MIFVEIDKEDDKSKLNYFFMISITQIINIVSSLILNKFTKFEKYTSKSKEIFSDISKYFWLNFLLSMTLYFKKGNTEIFSYLKSEDYYILSKVTILNMAYSIIFSQASILGFYILKILKRFSDSKYSNGLTTQLNNKAKYEQLYLGPEFPFEERYSKILVNLAICLLYGSNCPAIYFFFVAFLIVTFLIDKFLMIYYYKKPPLYGDLLSKKILNYFFFCLILYIYGLFYNISNPYLFRNYVLKSHFEKKSYSDIGIFGKIYFFFNPFTLYYYLNSETYSFLGKINFLYYNFNSEALLIHYFVFLVLFLNPASFIKKKFTPKSKFLSFLNISPIEIGTVYPLEELKKYYEIKKLQLFNLIIDNDKNVKFMDNYSYLVNNYMLVIRYLKQNIDNKSNKQQNKIDINSEMDDDEYSPLKGEDIIRNNQLQISGDISYNQSFISKYQIYNNYNLIKNI